MARRHFHLSDGAVFVLLLCAGFVLLLLPGSMTHRLNFWYADTFEPLIRMGRRLPAHSAEPAPNEEYVSRDEYDALWATHQNLQAQLVSLQAHYETVARIRTALPRFDSGLIVAEIVASPARLAHDLLINKGADDGIRPGCYVMCPDRNSIIGVVRETSGRMARVRLLTDINQSIEIRLRRSGSALDVGALMFGDGRRGGTVSKVERERDIRVGDAVFAASRPGLLDVPLIVGVVSDVRPDEESPLLWKIAVQPTEHAPTQGTVAVIVPDTLETGRR